MKELRKTYIQLTEEEDKLISDFETFCENCYNRIEDSVLGELFFDIKQNIEKICSYYDYGNEFDDSTEIVNNFDPFEIITFTDDTYSEDIEID